jgi:hypothetical protein
MLEVWKGGIHQGELGQLVTAPLWCCSTHCHMGALTYHYCDRLYPHTDAHLQVAAIAYNIAPRIDAMHTITLTHSSLVLVFLPPFLCFSNRLWYDGATSPLSHSWLRGGSLFPAVRLTLNQAVHSGAMEVMLCLPRPGHTVLHLHQKLEAPVVKVGLKSINLCHVKNGTTTCVL